MVLNLNKIEVTTPMTIVGTMSRRMVQIINDIFSENQVATIINKKHMVEMFKDIT